MLSIKEDSPNLIKNMPFGDSDHALDDLGVSRGLIADVVKDDLVFLAKDKGSWRHMQVLVKAQEHLDETMSCDVNFICSRCKPPAAKSSISFQVLKDVVAGDLADAVAKRLKEEHGVCLGDL